VDYEFIIDGNLDKVSLEKKEEQFYIFLGKKSKRADIRWISDNVVSLLIGGKSYCIYLASDKKQNHISINGHYFLVEDPSDEDEVFAGGEQGSQEDALFIKSPMPGKVIKIDVKEKQAVRKNQTLVVVEAMKMENEIKSLIEGQVKKINAAPGDLVDPDMVLIELEKK
jgi:biotin carboxyl carrier protein